MKKIKIENIRDLIYEAQKSLDSEYYNLKYFCKYIYFLNYLENINFLNKSVFYTDNSKELWKKITKKKG